MNELFVNLPLSDFIEWCQKFRTFLNCDEIDRNHPTHKDWLNHVVGPISFYRKGSQGDSSKAFLEKPPNQHRLSKLGMCCLNNKSPFDVLHPSTEVFAFCVLKGKFRLTPELVCWTRDQPIPGQDLITSWKEVVNFALKPRNAIKKVSNFSSIPEGAGSERGWEDAQIVAYGKICSAAVSQHQKWTSASGLDCRPGVFNFTNELDQTDLDRHVAYLDIRNGTKRKTRPNDDEPLIDYNNLDKVVELDNNWDMGGDSGSMLFASV
jgi:hypothetical protein